MWRKGLLFSLVVLLSCQIPLKAQVPFTRGVNLTGWFQADGARRIQFTKYSRKDFENIKSLGCDVVRLPVNLHSMTLGSPSYTIDPLLFTFLDSAVTWAEELDLYLIIDNHSFDPNENTSPGIVDILVKVWPQMAMHYSDRSDHIIYEVLNEPHGIAASTWGSIQGQVIDAIRAVDTRHLIIVGGVGFNTYTELQNIHVYSDPKLIYTFHFYDPFMFTHQGSTWNVPSMAPLAGVPFPYNSSEMPAIPPTFTGTWMESAMLNYPSQGNVDYVKSLIDIAVAFRNDRNAAVFCGEFGVFIPNSDPADRRYWYSIVRRYLEKSGIPWTTWDYQGGFGLFTKGSNEMFDHDLDLDLLDSLGLNKPPQRPFVQRPDSVGFMVYSDFTGSGITDVSYGGNLDYYSSEMPNNGRYCMKWKSFGQYNTIGFGFSPDKDLSRLTDEGYSLDFLVRGNAPGIKFDIRFIDSKTGDTDHPWRLRFVIDETVAAWDKRWHHVNISLDAFTEHGAWDNGTWYNPQGLYDRTKVDRLEVSTEYTGTTGKEIWLDNVYVTDQDTAIVREPGTVGVKDLPADDVPVPVAYPNPFGEKTMISFTLHDETPCSLNIISSTGEIVRSLMNEERDAGAYAETWDGTDQRGTLLPPGLYLCVLTTSVSTTVRKLVKR